jgi:hypothetical protein
MKVLIALALAFAIVMTFEPLAARADDGDAPVPPPRFRPGRATSSSAQSYETRSCIVRWNGAKFTYKPL